MPKTANEEVLDAVVRHQIFLLRYSAGVRNRVIDLLNKSEEELARRIRDSSVASSGLNSPTEWKRLQRLLAQLRAIRSRDWRRVQKLLLEEMEQFAYQEPIRLQQIYTGPLPVVVTTTLPSTPLLRQIAIGRPFEGRLLKDWVKNLESDDVRRMHSAVQAGMVAGEDHATIARRVVGTARARGTNGSTEVTRRQIQAITRTAVQHIANGARDAFFDSNKALFTVEQYVATLDSRTTEICRGLDGRRFPIGEGPHPPLHFNCRSVRIAAIDGVFAGSRPAKPTTERILVREYATNNSLAARSRDALPRGHKGPFDAYARSRIRQLVGPVPATTTYQKWLAGQSTAFQDEVLGVTRGVLFRRGELTLDRFVDLHTGKPFTLSELASKHRTAFIAAGLDPDSF